MKTSEALLENLNQTRSSFKDEFDKDLPDEMVRNAILDILREKTNTFIKTRYRDWSAKDLGNLFALVVPGESLVEEAPPSSPGKKRGRPAKS